MRDQTVFPTLGDLALGLTQRRLDPVDLADQALDGLANGGDTALLIDRLPQRARSEALAARLRLADGKPASPLDGVPSAWKDLFDLTGRVTTAGSVVLKSELPAARDAAIVDAARRAGVVSVGTLNMNEFAYSAIGFNPHYGTPRNPNGTGPARVPGGSSSGSAVAVARGILAFAIGTDTGGSIRVPASFNGIVGFKASTHRYPMSGVFPLARTLDSLGPLARSVADCILVDAVLRSEPRPPVQAAPLAQLQILIPENVVFDGCENAVLVNFEASCERLARAGARIERIGLPAFDLALQVIAQHGSIVAAEAYELHRLRASGAGAAQFDPRVLKRIQAAAGMTAGDLALVREARARLIAETQARIGNSLIAFPAVSHVAPELGPLVADDDLFTRVNAKTLRNTMLGNFLDWCGVSIPCGTDAAGMPTGFLLSAPHGHDEPLLAAALAVEPLVRGSQR